MDAMINHLNGIPCRICRKGSEIEPLMVPCECRGMNLFAHTTCIRRYLRTHNRYTCHMCGVTIDQLTNFDKWIIGMYQIGFTRDALGLLIYWWIQLSMFSLTVGIICARLFGADRTTVMINIELMASVAYLTFCRRGVPGNLISVKEKMLHLVMLILARITTVQVMDKVYGILALFTNRVLINYLLELQLHKDNSRVLEK